MRMFVPALALCTALGACGGSTQPQLEVSNTAGSPVGHDAGTAAMTATEADTGAGAAAPISRQLDAADQRTLARTRQSALETVQPNQALAWQNRQSGNSGTIVPGQYYETAQGQYCREFRQNITVGGETQQGSGKACRQPDGIWRVIE